MCQHGSGPVDRCSQCLGIAAHRVEQSGSVLTIDGAPARAIDLETPTAQKRYGSRGGKALHASKEKRR
jgi:hypothetical protein